jgi:hypothetical protein
MATCVALHAHHEASLPIELLGESYASRLETINTTKARVEEPWQIELRKKLFREILPADMPTWLADLWKQSDDLLKQRDDLLKQRNDLWKQRNDLWKQRNDLLKLKQRDEKLIAFHDSICDCGWSRTNNNIFDFPRL